MKTPTPIQELIDTFEEMRSPIDSKVDVDFGISLMKSMLEKEKDMFEEIIDIIDSENSGHSAEQRLNEIKKYIKIFNTKE